MPESAPTGPRRSLMSLHGHLVLTGMLSTAAFAFVIGVSIFVPIATQIEHAGVGSPEALGFAEHFLYLHAGFWPVILVSLIGSVASGTVLYRKMREPIVRFVDCYEAIARGETPPPVMIRTSDYLLEEAEALNTMIEALERERLDVRHAGRRLEELVAEIASTPGIRSESLEALHSIAKGLQTGCEGTPDVVPPS